MIATGARLKPFTEFLSKGIVRGKGCKGHFPAIKGLNRTRNVPLVGRLFYLLDPERSSQPSWACNFNS